METKYHVLAIMGKAGAGKDTVQRVTAQTHPELFHSIISCTTRPPRDNEKNGQDYHFLTITEFTRKVLNGEMLEATEFRNWFYGTSIDSLVKDKINIGVFNPAGIEALLSNPELITEVIWVNAEDKTRLMRYLNRSENPDCAEMCRRYFADEKDFADIDFGYYAISNEDGETIDLTERKEVYHVLNRMMKSIGLVKDDNSKMRSNLDNNII